MRHPLLIHRALIPIVMTIALGCEQPDERVERIMHDSLIRQAEHNQQIAEQSQLSTKAAERVVEVETAARTEAVQLQRDIVQRDTEGQRQLTELSRETQARLADERLAIDVQRAALESERKQIASERIREPIIAQTIGQLGTLLICLLPLLLAGYVLYSVNRSTVDDRGVSELLITEFVAGGMSLMPTNHPALPFTHASDSEPLIGTDQLPAEQ